MDELLKAVLEWWEKHQYDETPTTDGDWDNLYSRTPEFVEIAKKMEKHNEN